MLYPNKPFKWWIMTLNIWKSYMCTWLDVSSYLDKIMAPIVKTLLSYIKDSQHALEIFRDFNFLGQNKLVFTMDITSLYTVIPNDEGLRALRHFFDQRTVKEPCSETLLRLAELALTLNCFSFIVTTTNKLMAWPWILKWTQLRQSFRRFYRTPIF